MGIFKTCSACKQPRYDNSTIVSCLDRDSLASQSTPMRNHLHTAVLRLPTFAQNQACDWLILSGGSHICNTPVSIRLQGGMDLSIDESTSCLRPSDPYTQVSYFSCRERGHYF